MSSPSPAERFRDVTPAILPKPARTAKGVIQWTETGGARIVHTYDTQMPHGALARTYLHDEGRLLGYTMYADQILIHESSTSQIPAADDREWLREAIKGTPLWDKIVIVEYESNDGKIREQIHP